jgi:thiamine pyrophosphate-dependent acetolactate synthase large subunit-like protein
MTASAVFVEGLIDCGVDVIFGLPGDGINGFVEALRIDGPVVIQCDADPNEPPMPPKATKGEMKHLAEALMRGDKKDHE